MKEWIDLALSVGFSAAAPLDPKKLVPKETVRAMCAEDQCRSYGKNWTCPPACGTVEECAEKMHGFSRGILLQTVGKLSKTVDTKAYLETDKRHAEQFRRFADAVREKYPRALCLGAGGCRICDDCAYPDPCRFPEKALSSMEAYGLFVTEVCRDCGLPYYHGEKTITYTACVLFD